MRSIVRVFAFLAALVGSALAAAWASLNPVIVSLASVTALIMGGTQSPLVGFGPLAQSDSVVQRYLDQVTDRYIDHVVPDGTTLNEVAVYTPEEFGPFLGSMTFDESVTTGVANLSMCLTGGSLCPRNEAFGTPSVGDTFVVFGYSQSGRIITDVKRSLIDYYSNTGWEDAPDASFVMIGNPDRPNGGLLERFAGLSIPFFGITFDGATPTDSCDTDGCHLPTVDIAYQYDAVADFPSHPLNLLADLNALLGLVNHGKYLSVPLTDAVEQGSYGDTTYYMIPVTTVPLLLPVAWLLPAPIVALLDAPLRTIIEMGYDRDTNPGVPTPAKWFRFSPIRDLITIGIAVATGIDDALAMATGDPDFRPLGTTPAGMYGVPEFKFSDLLGTGDPADSGTTESLTTDDPSAAGTDTASDAPTTADTAQAAVSTDAVTDGDAQGADPAADGIEAVAADAPETTEPSTQPQQVPDDTAAVADGDAQGADQEGTTDDAAGSAEPSGESADVPADGAGTDEADADEAGTDEDQNTTGDEDTGRNASGSRATADDADDDESGASDDQAQAAGEQTASNGTAAGSDAGSDAGTAGHADEHDQQSAGGDGTDAG